VASGALEGLVIFGQNIVSLLDADIAQAKWSIFLGSNENKTSKQATLVIPTATYIEKEGTFTNFEGHVQLFSKVLEPLGEAKPEIEIFSELAKPLGSEWIYENTEAIFLELAKKEKDFETLHYDELRTGGSKIRQMAAPTIPDLEQYDNIL